MGLLGQLAQEECGHRAAEADVQLVDLAFRPGDNPDAKIGQALVEPGNMFLIAGHTVERFGDEHIETAGHGALRHLLEAGTQMCGSADGFVGKDNPRPTSPAPCSACGRGGPDPEWMPSTDGQKNTGRRSRRAWSNSHLRNLCCLPALKHYVLQLTPGLDGAGLIVVTLGGAVRCMPEDRPNPARVLCR